MPPINPPDFNRDVHCLLGLPFDATDLPGAVHCIREAVAKRKPLFVSTPNLNFLIACQTDSDFRNSVIISDLSLADGMPIVWLSRLLRIPLRERIAGSTLFENLKNVPNEPPLKIFFFGGNSGVAQDACHRINNEKTSLQCVGFESPGFGSIQDMSTPATIQHINASQADFVVVSLGARKGQAWIENCRLLLNAPVISHLGAVLNMAAGAIQRAPRWMQRSGLEWLWRIKEEPSLWRRYFADALALTRLLALRALPLAWLSLGKYLPSNSLMPASITTDLRSGCFVITLAGNMCRSTIGPLRDVFARATLVPNDLTIELRGVISMDSAFLGLLILAHGYQRRMGHRLVIDSPSRNLLRIFHFSNADFLLEHFQFDHVPLKNETTDEI